MIYLRDVSKIPGDLIVNGQVSLDFSSREEGLRITRKLGELTDLGRIKIDGVLEFTVPRSDKNDIIFAKQLNFNNMCFGYTGIFVDVFDGPLHYNEDFITVLSFDDKNITCELGSSQEHWINALHTKRLNDINYSAFGVFEYTIGNIMDNMENGFKWEDDAFLGHFAPIWFGQNRIREEDGGQYATIPINCYSAYDMRPVISVLGSIRKAFCEERWNFRSPFLESDKGRRIWAYLNKPEYYLSPEDNERGRMLNFRASFVATGPLPFWTSTSGPIPFTDDSIFPNFDVGDCYNNTYPSTAFPRWMWTNPLPFSHLMTFGVNLVLNVVVATDIDIYIKRWNGFEVDSIKETFSLAAGETRVVSFEWETVVNPGDSVYVTSVGGRVMDDSSFYGRVAGKMLYIGDMVDLGECVRDDFFMDYFKGIVQALQGKLETDWITRTVWLHISETTQEPNGDVIPGFYQENDDDISSLVIEGSRKVKIDRDQRYKRYIAKWADSTDEEIIRLEVDETLHEKRIELDNDYTEEWIDENPYFEPTLNREMQTKVFPRGTGTGIDVPWMIDNLEEKISYNIGPRLLLSLGYVAQSSPSNYEGLAETTPIIWLFQHPSFSDGYQQMTYLAYLAQKPNATHYAGLVQTNDLFLENLVFGNQPFDLYNQYKEISVLEQLIRYNIEYLVKYDYNRFFSENFRLRKFINYGSQPQRLKLIEMRDFNELTPTPMSFRLAAYRSTDGPCNCFFTTCLFYMPFTNALSQGEYDLLSVSSVIADGTQYVMAPIPFGTKDVVMLGPDSYVQNFPQILRDLEIPSYTWTNKKDNNNVCKTCWFEGKTPSCHNWEIVVQYDGDNMYRWTRDGFFIWTGVIWSQKMTNNTINPRPQYCVTAQIKPSPCSA